MSSWTWIKIIFYHSPLISVSAVRSRNVSLKLRQLSLRFCSKHRYIMISWLKNRIQLKCCAGFIVLVLAMIMLYFYLCSDNLCSPHSSAVSSKFKTVHASYLREHLSNPKSNPIPTAGYCNISSSHPSVRLKGQFLEGKIFFDLDESTHFAINERDIMVFLHIQKTGGTTFGRHLVKDIDLEKPCECHRGRKRCDCENRNDHVWLFSRYSTGWRCGLHADWTELTECVHGMLNKLEEKHRNRRYWYITMLRDPVYRYISEFKHVQRGATWKSARLQCRGKQATLEQVPFCFDGEDWEDVTFEEFTSCSHNLANNRQARMLANLSLTNCYSEGLNLNEQDKCVLLQSAKENLNKLAFFGLMEFQHESQYMFEKTFGLNFHEDFFQYSNTHASEVGLSSKQKDVIKRLNDLSIQLYQYAKELFFQRLRKMQQEDQTFSTKFPGDFQKIFAKHPDEFEEGSENFAEEDDAFNHRIIKKS